jgi:hypothetical protein
MMDDWTYERYTSGGWTERNPDKAVQLVQEFWRREMPDKDFAEAVIEFAKRYPRYADVLSGVET